MNVTLVKIYIEGNSHDIDIEMFRVYKEVDLLIEPKKNHKITLEKGSFFVQQIEQNLKEKIIYLYETTEISHYQFYSHRENFRKKFLPRLLKEDWIERKLNE